ncbi:hypothetical protein ONE63_011349 [Megalurothrips usitatus]|uniref:BEN domain-containing protein n=1 Tax=Megalurothrips usitatus TaxID=439358 RepID=A0AAV7X2W1_9NEOP|nr:hypothetical protein ONE63_011349 [Megalurothrips usitatus]
MLNVSNKMREEIQKKSKSLEESAKNTQDKIDLLRRRNGALQDALTDRALAGPSPKERHRNRAHHQTEKEKDKRSHSHSSDHGGISKKLKSSQQSSHSTPIKSTSPACSPDSSFSAIDFLHDTDLNDVCDRVQKHLQKTEVITPDSKGRINVGCNVKWDVKSFEDIVENNKVNVTKMAQNLAMQTWSKKERVDRSLDGKKRNRFPNTPVKQAATPSKVKAIIGAVKAVMKSLGDQEGPSMAFTLKSCRSAVGHKFSNEAFKSQLDFS